MTEHRASIFNGTLLVAGTTIGAGMLGLPVATAQAGFLPSILIYIVCWAFMACTGLLLLETCLWWKEDKNIVSIAGHTLGTPGRAFAWVWYLFLFYCLTLAYVVGGGNFVRDAFCDCLTSRQSTLIFVAIFGTMVYIGPAIVARLNILLMFGLLAAYFAFVVLGAGNVDTTLLARTDWSALASSLPIVFVAFAYQGLVPTLTRHMGYDLKRTRAAILIGSFIPLVGYVIWQGLILGIVPLEGAGGLLAAKAAGQSAVPPLKQFIQNPFVYYLGQFFAFFALATSFLGVTLGLVDFIADGLNIKKTAIGKLGLCLIVFIPPLILAEIYPTVFLSALDLAGGLGVALLLGLLPIVMVAVGRYYLRIPGPQLLPGGVWTLLLLVVFVIIELIIEVVHLVARV